jgi:hypothetical protein
MKKAKKAVPRGRMTELSVAGVVAEIAAYERGAREVPLSWSVLEKFSGYSRISLWAKPTIKAAFQAAQQATRADVTPAIKVARTSDQRIVSLQAALAEVRETLRAYDEMWALYEYNMHRLGLDPGELRRPLDPLARGEVRSRRVRVVR